MSSFEFPGAWYEAMRPDMRDLDAETQLLTSLVPAGGRLLDLACGTGTNVRALVAAGYDCTGVDRSSSFIDYAKNTGLGEFVCCPVEEYQTRETYDCVFSLFASLNCVPRSSLSQLFSNILSWLRPGGTFVLDVAQLLNFVDTFQTSMIGHHHRDGLLITRLSRQAVQPHAGIWRNDETLVVRETDGTVQMHENFIEQTVLTPAEVLDLLAAAGFTVSSIYGGFHGEPPARNGRGPLILVSTTPGSVLA